MYENLSSMHRAVAERLGPRTAIRYKTDGLYHDLSWEAYRREADAIAAALIGRDINAGDRVALLSENRREWLVADIGMLAAGAVTVPLHATLSPAQIAYQINHSQCRGVFVSNQEQADKIFSILEKLFYVSFVVAMDRIEPRGDVPCVSWDGFVHEGLRASDAVREERRRREAERRRDELATIIYTSGTTGNPKGVMLTHGNLLTNAEAMVEVAQVGPDDVLLSWLPYSHIYARTVDHYLTIRAESTLCLAERTDTVVDNLAEIHPTWITAVPRLYERVWSSVESLSPEERNRRLKEIFGPRIRWLSSGGAPLPEHIARGFLDAGLLLLEGYGLTETSPAISFNRLDRHRIGSVGLPVRGVEVTIADDGEILARGPSVTPGYWRFSHATNAAFQGDWLRTGDLGRLDDDGFLYITGRKKDLIVTSTGKNVAPAQIEQLLSSDPLIDHAIVVGDNRPYLTAVLVVNRPAIEAEADRLGCGLDLRGDWIESEPLRECVARKIEDLLAELGGPEKVRDFLLLGRPLSIESEELTPTLKVRRQKLLEQFGTELDALYARRRRDAEEA